LIGSVSNDTSSKGKEQALLREERYIVCTIQRCQTHPPNHLTHLLQMAIEYIFTTTVISMMVNGTDAMNKPLNEEEAAQLERLAFDYFNKQAEKYDGACCWLL
jgi:hypothetical protein